MPSDSSRFSRFFSKSRRRNAAETSLATPVSAPTVAPTPIPISQPEDSSTRGSSQTCVDDVPSTSTKERNLWNEALEKLPPKLQTELEARGLKKEGAESFALQIKKFQEEAKVQQARSEERDWKVRLGNREIPVRQLTVNITKWATEIGDVAIKFAPSPGAGVWGVITYLLQGIDIFDTEKSALLSVVDKVAGALFRGQTYYAIYTIERTKRLEIVEKLHDALVELYSCVLELLVKSSDLASNTAVQFCHAIFDTKKPSAMLSDLEKHEKALQTTAELCEVTAHARQDDELREHVQKAQAFIENFEEYMAVVNNQEREQLLEWVSKVPYGRHFDDIEEKRSPGTGEWLVEHPLFQEWMDYPSSKVLWLQGYPGTGKTYLTSSVVRHIMNKMEPQKDGLSYFFCNQAEKDRSETLPILQCLVRQLAAPKSNNTAVRKSLKQARTLAIMSGSHLSLSECRNQLQESLKLYSTTVIILDALDEVSDDELSILIEELDDLMSQNRDARVKLFISSRPEEEIENVYSSGPTITIQASDNRTDIQKFVDAKLDDIAKTKPKSPVNGMRQNIVDSIYANCGNVFLWVDLQLKQIQRCKSPSAIEYELRNLPRGLGERYDRIMSQIEKNPFLDAQMAKRALKWVLAAPEPLTTEEITCAARINIEMDSLDLKDEMIPESLLAICENLLMIDSEGRWRFFHLSVREYLKEKQGFKNEAHSFCAEVCFLSLMRTFENPCNILYVSESEFAALDMPEPSGPSAFIELKDTDPFQPWSSFSFHIQNRWPFYASELNADDTAFALLKKFLGSSSASSEFFVNWSNFVSKSELEYPYNIFPNTTPLFAIVFFSLHKVLCESSGLEGDDYDMLQLNLIGESLLEAAAKTDCVPICEYLVAKLASIDKSDADQERAVALIAAIHRGNWNTVRYLVEEAHTDLNFPISWGEYGSALATAVIFNRMDMVKYLVEAGADVNLALQTGHFDNALTAATALGDLKMVEYLVETRAKENIPTEYEITKSYKKALIVAISRGNSCVGKMKCLVENLHIDVNLHFQYDEYDFALSFAIMWYEVNFLPYLVDDGADANLPLQSGHYISALTAAVWWGRQDAVEYLVEAGADANFSHQFGNCGSPLVAAAWRDLDMVQYLVEEANADVNLLLQGKYYGSALAAAAGQEHLEMVRYLVEKAHAEVDLLLQGGFYGSALAAAAGQGHLVIVKYLVEEGHADVNLLLRHGGYGSVLAAAARWDEVDIAKYLVDAGAEVNLHLESGGYGSALAAAAGDGRMDMVKYMVEEAHAEVNLLLPHGDYGSALAAAAGRADLEMVRYLVEEAHAEVNILLPHGNYDSALAAAVLWDEVDIAKYLVDAGADVNLHLERGGYGSALAAAAGSGNMDMVKYLVEGGADVNLPLQSGNYGSALAAAVRMAEPEVVEYLVKAGADVNLPLQFGRYSSVLTAAATAGGSLVEEGLDMECDSYADFEIQCSDHGIPLDDTTAEKHLHIVKYLVEEAHAELNLPLSDGTFANALVAAKLTKRNKNVVEYLEEKANSGSSLS